jgi:dipeptidyl aminopeptidase/acylaminoacyl peptidase
MRIAWLGIASLILTGAALAQPRGRALAIEDYYRLKIAGNPRISPDGRWVAYTVASRLERDNSSPSATFVVPADGSAPPRRIQREGGDVSNPRWTPGGDLQVAVGRDVWVVSLDSAAAPVRAVTLPSGAVLSPDGKSIARVREKPSPKPEPVYASEFEKRHMERFKGVQFDWMNFQRDGEPFPAPDPTARPPAEIVIEPAAGGEGREITNLGYRPANLAWHPAGQAIAFTADAGWRVETRYARADLWTVTLEGRLTRLTNDGYAYANPEYSPDGRFLSYQRTFGVDMIIQQRLNHGGANDLFILPVDGGEPVNLTAGWDYEPAGVRWSPDSRYLYFSAGVGGATHLFRVAPRAGAPVEQMTRGERRLTGIDFDASFSKIAYTVGLRETPADVWVASIDGSNERKLTAINEDLAAEVAFSNADRLMWKSHDGTQIEGWLLYPHGYSREKGPYPLIVNSHGGPHSAVGYAFDFKQQFFAANGYFVLDTNFRGSTAYGDAFKWATWGAWGTKDGQDVISGVDHVIRNYPVDARRVAAMGHSYGGFMTNWLITQYPDRFAAAASGAGISNWISDYGTADIFRTKETEFFGPPWQEEARGRMILQSPLTYAGRVKTPVLFLHGELDHRVPFEEGEQMYFALKRRGVPAKMIRYAGMAHGITGHWNAVHRMINELNWFNEYVKNPAGRQTPAGR